MNTDFVVGISDQATNYLNLIFNTEIGQKYLIEKKGLEDKLVKSFPEFGFSSIANILASIKLAKYMNLSSDDAILTIATDGADLYSTELEKIKKDFVGSYDTIACAELYGQYFQSSTTDHMLELNQRDKERIFNLGYYTWVEQQGVSIEDFEIRRSAAFWDALHKMAPVWDELIGEFNGQTGVGV